MPLRAAPVGELVGARQSRQGRESQGSASSRALALGAALPSGLAGMLALQGGEGRRPCSPSMRRALRAPAAACLLVPSSTHRVGRRLTLR